ncbi:nitroreductase family protein [Acetohalobium arabaticum]|uniref:Nitroreductase n=1 Tax=Acetohalobium arabaticum (strain ATCC 49924 / DSM 5501 / Z-7288) TaxID=574087 RepID=D9QR72_ACEAZ|nr:nitroreductase family protein [Acetohalobium arabaticum]ADL13013.1 nitroreductase [Acetohalobium arabaticum DSM 5501]
MKLPVDEWLEAVKVRKSRRRFIDRPIEEEKITRMERCCVGFRPFSGVRGKLVKDSADEVFSGVIGSYGSVKGTSSYIVFIGDTTTPNVEAKVGYLGEGLVLEATLLGLSTCWIGGFFKPEVAAKQIDLAEKEKVFAVTPLGYTKESKSFEEKVMGWMAKSHQRKSLSEIAAGYNEDNWPGWVKQGLKAARVAPSAVNRQPWRFNYDKDSVLLSLDNTKDKYDIPKELDCGIAMLHFELGALKAGVKGSWEFLSTPKVARYKLEKLN